MTLRRPLQQMTQIPKLAVTTMVPLVYDIAQFHYSSSSEGSGTDREIVAISEQDILSNAISVLQNRI
jgi:hypothetical protein